MIQRILPASLALLLSFGAVSASLQAQEKAEPKPEEKPVSAKQIQELLKRIESLEAEVRTLKRQPAVPADPKQQRVAVLLETPYFGSPTYYSSLNSKRIFLAKLILINLTPNPVNIDGDAFKLNFDGTDFSKKEVPSNVRNYPIQMSGQTIYLRNIKPLKKISVPTGGSVTTWVLFSDLPQGKDIPNLSLKIPLPGDSQTLDINAYCRARLQLDVERIGPSKSLGLVTVGGSIDTVNVGDFVAELEALARQRLARVIIRFSKSASPLDSRVSSWLVQSASNAGTGRAINLPFPGIPSAFRELHLAEMPGIASSSSRTYTSSSSASATTHKKVEDAVTAALGSAFEVLPREALLKEIQTGHPLTQAAALSIGGGRLSVEDLPLILKYADDQNPKMQSAALTALRHFGEAAATEKLVEYLMKNKEPLASVAAESLAGSRFETANLALLKVLKKDGLAQRKQIIAILAKHARPIWGETIYEFVTDPNSGVGVEALNALVQIGHPKLFDVLKDSLKSSDATIHNAAFSALVKRNDPDSEKLASEFTITRLKKGPPTSMMTSLLNRTKDPAAVPLLLKHLDNASVSRTTIISTLGIIGDNSVVPELTKRYTKLKNAEQAAVLTALTKLNNTEFLKIAAKAVESGDRTVLTAACQGLQVDASDEATGLLVKALNKTSSSTSTFYICNALSTIGTPAARRALIEARQTGSTSKRNYARNALNSLYSRSPGRQYVSAGQAADKNEDYKTAEQQFAMAIEVDPDLPTAYLGRGNTRLKVNKVAEARQDFEQAAELDPYNSHAVTGIGVVLVLEGKIKEGVAHVEAKRSKFVNESLYLYNTACVYGRALEKIKKDKSYPDRDKVIPAYRDKALADLQNAIKRGFRDLEWMKKDPDLKSLHEYKEFDTVVKGGPAGK